jgi:hypothetical protein
MVKDKKNLLIIVLAVAVGILLIVSVFALFVRPALNGLVIRGYNQGQVDFLSGILYQVQQSGFVNLPVGNQTLTLVPYIGDSSAA